MLEISDERKTAYEKIIEFTKVEWDELNEFIEMELEETKAKIEQLNNKKQGALQIYNGACTMLGVANEFNQEDQE